MTSEIEYNSLVVGGDNTSSSRTQLAHSSSRRFCEKRRMFLEKKCFREKSQDEETRCLLCLSRLLIWGEIISSSSCIRGISYSSHDFIANTDLERLLTKNSSLSQHQSWLIRQPKRNFLHFFSTVTESKEKRQLLLRKKTVLFEFWNEKIFNKWIRRQHLLDPIFQSCPLQQLHQPNIVWELREGRLPFLSQCQEEEQELFIWTTSNPILRSRMPFQKFSKAMTGLSLLDNKNLLRQQNNEHMSRGQWMPSWFGLRLLEGNWLSSTLIFTMPSSARLLANFGGEFYFSLWRLD